MKEAIGNLWDFPCDARVITTNGFIKNNGFAVMGRGCAKEAVAKYPQLPQFLGQSLKINGNRVFIWKFGDDPHLITMPVKHSWNEYADIHLITKSAKELEEVVTNYGFQNIVMPQAGCGNGGRDWAQVRPILGEILDDRFTAVTFA